AVLCGVSSIYLGGDYKFYLPGTKLILFETISIFTIPLMILAVLTNITAFKRLMDAKKSLLEQQ
ncbi:MAG TPA: CDP-alcohol phosphatidyltransferase family protein, partial [Mucilaginibacter sp.]